jgi:protein TonB
MSPRKIVSIGLVVLLHALIGYAFITGLAYNVIKKAANELKTVDIKDQPPPPDKPPPPPPPQQKVEPPPVVAPPPIVRTETIAPPVLATVPKAPPVAPPVIAPPAPPAPPPVVHTISQAAQAKGNPASWVTTDDYPPGALRDGKQGRVVASWTINEQGRVDSCNVTSSSGVPELDDQTCKLIVRRARYTPAKDAGGNPVKQTDSRTFRWQIPDQ